MKKLFVVFLLIIGFSSLAQSQSKDELEIQNLIQNSFDELFSNLDGEKLDDYYTDDFLLLEQGEIWDKAIILGYFEQASKSLNRPIRTNRFEFITTKVDGNRGWVGYWNYATITKDGQVIQELKWLESATAVKTDKGWRLDMLHSTRVEKE